MLPFAILVHNSDATSPPPSNNISLAPFLEESFQTPVQSSFNRHARIPSLLSNIFLWFAFLLTVIVLFVGKQELSTAVRVIYGSMMLVIIITCYVFILVESKGCTEQVLLKKRVQIDIVKRELAVIQRQPKLTSHLTVTATNYYNSFQRKYIDYQLYDNSSWIRMQSCLSRNVRLIETPFHTRQYHITIPDFAISETHLCQLFFTFQLSIVGRDASIVHEDMKQEFHRLETKLFNSNTDSHVDFNRINQLARVHQHIHFQFHDFKQHDLLCGQRRTCLTYENKTKIAYPWLLTENNFWIMTCFGLSWLFRAVFACLITKLTVPIYIELEGTVPLHSSTIDREE